LDLFDGQLPLVSPQIHDFNPGIKQPSGLFWTVPIPRHNVEINLALGTARFHMSDVAIDDHHDLLATLNNTFTPTTSRRRFRGRLASSATAASFS